jgi:hypothetical protein
MKKLHKVRLRRWHKLEQEVVLAIEAESPALAKSRAIQIAKTIGAASVSEPGDAPLTASWIRTRKPPANHICKVEVIE